MKVQKTNAVRLLDKMKIPYSLVTYTVDENDLSATRVAQQLGQPAAQVFKTLVLRGNRLPYFVCVIPADKELDLKRAAYISGNKSCELLPLKELLPTTGYIRGACSPLAMKKAFPTFIHASATLFDTIFVSAGVRGMQVQVAPSALIGAVGMAIADFFPEQEGEDVF